MRNLTVTISEDEFRNLGLDRQEFSFKELKKLFWREEGRRNLREAQEMAKKYGLDKMTMDDIDAEIRAYRDAQDRS